MNAPHFILSPSELEALRLLDTCIVANAIETFDERLRNEGFGDNSVHCRFPSLGTMVGYAVPLKVRGSALSTTGHLYAEDTSWLDYLVSIPAPRVAVVQDVATRVGLGSFLGCVHVNILKTLGCVGAVTNGSVRDLPAAEALGFQLFSGGVTLSHAYVHILEFGSPVEIAGLKISPGTLLHGDQHGVQVIPFDLAAKIPAAVARIRQREEAMIEVCRSTDPSLEKVKAAFRKFRITR